MINIVFEGPTGAGKTTLIESYVKKLSEMGYRATYFHTSSFFNTFRERRKKSPSPKSF